MRTLMLILLAAPLLACGSSVNDDNPSDGGGGTGTGGSGGSPCASLDCAPTCPEQAPSHLAPCEGTLSCSYDTSVGNACTTTFEAVCTDGAWDALTPATCEAPTTCDPTGAFTFVYGEWTPEAPPTAAPGGLVLAFGDDGNVLSSAPGTTITDDGCTLTARWSSESCYEEGEETFCEIETFTAEVDFALETPSGTMTYECSGECGSLSTAPLTLQTP